jgi:hypothetical protein
MNNKGKGKDKDDKEKIICPYIGWDIYFENFAYEDFVNQSTCINAWIDMFCSRYVSSVVQVCCLNLVNFV